ncbi:outer membrane beta-barrel protein [Massilia sp. Dwa41.01b]|uniref:outer membrane beta-barrel protein n=1 Tax=unclassified Massilia TaxID=2609279 RepID=UPI001603222D|nr:MULTISPECIES: outer membrane beta-barrel protein [unclassified Massilia]QNA89150.1 outer membrane beta-barrel protein [Massilia sp. Dwa41.01b]QNB00043.1 outer membrane beta-barrel protein [Massilia sp. Se16.2.3]
MFKKIAVAAALVIASSSALAQQSPEWYVGADVGSTKIDGADRETGLGGFFGYKINKNFAVEAGYHRLAKADVAYYDPEFDADVRASAKFDQIDFSVIGTLPLSEGFNLYGRLGYNRLEIKSTATATIGSETGSARESQHENKVLYGLGLSYDFAPNVTGRLEVQKPHSDITKIAVGVALGF